MKVHLSLTGPAAGLTYCGAQLLKNERKVHMPLLRADKAAAFVDAHVTCEECAKIWRTVR